MLMKFAKYSLATCTVRPTPSPGVNLKIIPGIANLVLITHANESYVSIAIICVCVCMSVCPHDKTKTAKTTTTKLATGIVHHESSPSKDQKGRGQGHNVTKYKNIESYRVADVSYALYRVPSL